jgi:hypothetical protein
LNYEIPFRSKWVKKVTLGATTRNLLLLYPRSNRWGDPELVTGPGSEEVQSSRAAAASNASGAFTDEDTIGGTRFYGFNVNVNF